MGAIWFVEEHGFTLWYGRIGGEIQRMEDFPVCFASSKPPQEITGRRGYFGKRGSLFDSSQR